MLQMTMRCCDEKGDVMIDLDLRAMREAEKELEKRNQTIQPRICPFVTRCVKCGEPAPRWGCIACPECGHKFDNPEVDAISEAERIIDDKVQEETAELEERLLSVERWITWMSVFLGFYFLMKTAEIVIDWLR